MRRQRLLSESLVRRHKTRMGDVYMYRQPYGPPSDDAMDRWLHKTIQLFDFTPVFSGDQTQSRIVAQQFVQYLKTAAQREGKDWGHVSDRLKKKSPFIRRGLRTFFAQFDGNVKTKG